MILGKVEKRVVSHSKLARIPDRALMTVIPLEGYGDPKNPLIAIDTVSAGPGDTVLVLQEGTGARQASLADPSVPLPAQAVIVGVVDQIT
jgi:ethanolamine utilization protein EutN